MNFNGKDIISISDLSKEEILYVIKIAEKIQKKPMPKLLDKKIMASLFFEPSTRTRLSFETAMCKLGGKVVGFADPNVSSTRKGESLWDSIRTVDGYVDVIAMRHFVEGSARLAAEAAKSPVINGGDGANQHPTQTLLDLFTIKESQGKLEGLKIAMVGDLKYGRTVHSLAVALTHFNATLYFVAPQILQMPKYILEELKHKGIKFSLHKKIEEVIKKVDVLYMTRIQKERFVDEKEYDKVKNVYILKKSMLKGVKGNLRVMHPLPRVNEIEKDVDETPYAYYFEQAKNGVVVRQALLALVTGMIK